MLSTATTQREDERGSFQSHCFLAACALLTGLLCTFNIPVIGSFPASELILTLVAGVGLITFLLTKQPSNALVASPWLWAFLAAQLITLAGYAIADFYRESATADIARGWSRMGFLIIDTVAMAILFGDNIRNFRLFLLGSAFSGIIILQIIPAQYGDLWKFGYAWPVTTLVLLFVSNLGAVWSVTALCVLAGLHYIGDFRSLFGICLAAAFLVMINAFGRRQRMPIFLIGLSVATMGFFALTLHSAGPETTERGARSNVERSTMLTVAWQAFAESPWIGQGSWFSKSNVMARFLDLRKAAAEEAGVHGYSADDLDEKIAIHSQLLVSLAEGGILGGVFFAFFGICMLCALWYCIFRRDPDRYVAIFCLILMSSLWELFMSPFSGGHRIIIASAVGVVLFLFQEANLPSGGDGYPDAEPSENLSVPAGGTPWAQPQLRGPTSYPNRP